MPHKIRIVIVDDHQVIRTSWKLLFDSDPRFTVVAAYKNGQEALDSVEGVTPDIILMDINMFPMTGFETTERLLERSPGLRIIGVSANNYPGYAQKMIALGARGFVTKSSPFDELTEALVKVQDGEVYICHEITRAGGDGISG